MPRPPEPLDSYVMVEKSDVLEAIGQFVAAYLATMPEAQDLQPKQLQAALTQTFKVRLPPLSIFDYGPSLTHLPWVSLAGLAAVGSISAHARARNSHAGD